MIKNYSLIIFVIGILAAVFIAYLGWQTYRAGWAQHVLFDVPSAYMMGPEDADLTIVEFFSYDCAPCQNVNDAFVEALKQDGHILYIPRAIPYETEQSVHSAVLAYSAAGQGKFEKMHNGLINNFRILNEDVLTDISRLAEIDLEKLNKDMKDPIVPKLIEENSLLYNRLDLKSVPVFLMGRKLIFAPGEDEKPTVADFKKLFEEARTRQND